MMKRLATLACLTVLTLPAWAGFLDDDEARKAILELRAEVRSRDAEQTQKIQALTALNEQLNTQLTNQINNQISSLGIASANSLAKLRSDLADQSKQMDTLRGTILDLSISLKNTRDDNAKLRGMLEVVQNSVQLSNNELQASKRKQQEFEAANEARLIATEQRFNANFNAADNRFKKLEPRTIAVDGKEAVVDRAEESSFNAALNQFKAADYKSASRGFETFVAQYPQSGVLSTALFWLGNSQFAAKDPKSALETLQGMMQKFPQHVRAADAYLTIGHCYDELGDKKRSADQYNYVIQNFAGSPAAQAAQEALPKPVIAPAPPPVPAKPPVKKKV
jgi:tol-pal system protein YbgF